MRLTIQGCRIRSEKDEFCNCNYQIMCYNIISKGNRHRVVDLWYERRPSLSRSKYREGLYYFSDKSGK